MLPTNHRERATILIAAWSMGLPLYHSTMQQFCLRPKNECSGCVVTETFMKRYIRKNALRLEIKPDVKDN